MAAHIKWPLINVTSPTAEKRRARVRWAVRRGAARRGDIRVRGTEGERCGQQMTRRTSGGPGGQRAAGSGTFERAPAPDVKGHSLSAQPRVRRAKNLRVASPQTGGTQSGAEGRGHLWLLGQRRRCGGRASGSLQRAVCTRSQSPPTLPRQTREGIPASMTTRTQNPLPAPAFLT